MTIKTLDRDYLQEYPRKLIESLAHVGRKCCKEMYVTGGAVRDWLKDSITKDLDVTVPRDAFKCARSLASQLGGAFVPLDEIEEVARVVWHGFTVDFSTFREETVTIEQDLGRRDFTINALGVAFDFDRGELARPYQIIDPTDGISDLQECVVRATIDSVFDNDPLRLLRAFRFMAVLGFSLAKETEQIIHQQVSLISKTSPERISYELEQIIGSINPHAILQKMAEIGLLWVVFPELKKGIGVEQPASHHLDVFYHNLETLKWMEKIQQQPEDYFYLHGSKMKKYVSEERRKIWLRWAALFHDMGKPDAHAIKDERITFYNHDQTGANLFNEIAGRLRWSKEDSKNISRFIELHMWPFHLSNARLKTGITPKACLRLVKAVGEELPGLFLLSMADSLAGQGEGKPPAMEKYIEELYDQVEQVNQENIKPVFKGPPLLNGHDLIQTLGLAPSPIFKKILTELEEGQVAGEIKTRKQALEWVQKFIGNT